MNPEKKPAYMQERRKSRRKELFNLLGSTCVDCQSQDNLEFDHINPITKNFTLSGDNLDKPWDILLEEAKLCQVLCQQCHKEKTREEDKIRRPVHHGTMWMYGKYKCRCILCKKVYSEWKQGNRQRRKSLGLNPN